MGSLAGDETDLEPRTPGLVIYTPHTLICPALTHILTLVLTNHPHVHTSPCHLVTQSATLPGSLSLLHTQLQSHHPILLQSEPHLDRRPRWGPEVSISLAEALRPTQLSGMQRDRKRCLSQRLLNNSGKPLLWWQWPVSCRGSWWLDCSEKIPSRAAREVCPV